jgi:hypothetical protein
MNQIVHIFRKDCRRLWQIIAAVLVLTFLHGYGDATNPGGGVAIGLSPSTLFYILVGLSGLVLPIALFLLVVSVIQEESLVGSDKFWLTRPYGRLSLFLEKLMFVVLWAVVPMLLHDIVLVRYFGFSLTSASGLLLWKNAQFGFFLLVAATLAVLSASFARAVLFAIVAIIAAALTFDIVLQNSGGSRVGSGPTTYEILAVLAVAAVGALCVVAFQYRFRITSVATMIGVVAILVCALLARFWPESLTAYLSHRNDSPLLQSVQLLPDANLKGLPRPRPAQNAEDQARTAYYPFRATGLSDFPVDLVGLSAQFEAPAQKPASFYPSAQVRFQPPAGTGKFADAGGPDQLVPFTPNFPEDYARLQNTDGTLSGKLYLEGFRSAVARVSVPPPRTKQDLVIGGRRCRIGSFFRGSKLVLTFDCVELEPGSTSQFQVRLLKNHQEIIQTGGQGQTSSAGGWPAFLSPIVKTYSQSEFEAPASAEGLIDESTLGLELVVFAEQRLGAEVRDFRIEHFRPAEFSLRAWEQRGVLRAESTGTQSNGGTSPRSQ